MKRDVYQQFESDKLTKLHLVFCSKEITEEKASTIYTADLYKKLPEPLDACKVFENFNKLKNSIYLVSSA